MTAKHNYFYNQNQVRFNLISTAGNQSFNWLFFPGGPGADSSYFFDFENNLWTIPNEHTKQNEIMRQCSTAFIK